MAAIFQTTFSNTFPWMTVWISIKISLKFGPRVPINNIPALVQIMACRRPGDKPLSEPMMVSLLKHICVARPQWVNTLHTSDAFINVFLIFLMSSLVSAIACITRLRPITTVSSTFEYASLRYNRLWYFMYHCSSGNSIWKQVITS